MVHASTELQGDVRPSHLFVQERSEAALVHGGRERLGAHGLERTIRGPQTDAALEASGGPMTGHDLQLRRVVPERRPNLGALQLVVLVPAMSQRDPKRVEGRVQALGTAAQRQRVPPGRQLQDAAFDDGYSVLQVVVAVAASEKALRSGPRKSDVAKAA